LGVAGSNIETWENWVYSTETVRKSESDRMGARSCKDFVWSKEFIGKLSWKVMLYEELSLDITVVTNLEFQKPEVIRNQWEFWY